MLMVIRAYFRGLFRGLNARIKPATVSPSAMLPGGGDGVKRAGE